MSKVVSIKFRTMTNSWNADLLRKTADIHL